MLSIVDLPEYPESETSFNSKTTFSFVFRFSSRGASPLSSSSSEYPSLNKPVGRYAWAKLVSFRFFSFAFTRTFSCFFYNFFIWLPIIVKIEFLVKNKNDGKSLTIYLPFVTLWRRNLLTKYQFLSKVSGF